MTSDEGKRLEGKVVIITGAASGIGEASARLFVAHGAKVIVADIQDSLGENVVAELGPCANYFHCDVTQESDVSALVDFAMSKYGRVDVMFNNAGVANLGMGSVAQLNMKEFDKVIEVNVRGVILGVKHAARVMIPARQGCILCTGSVAGVLPAGSSHPYTISKHAVIGIVKSTAGELGKHGIRVNGICPSAIATPMLVDAYSSRLNRSVSIEDLTEAIDKVSDLQGVGVAAEDIARAALYLASDDGRYVSGHNLVVDGGFTASKPFNLQLHL